MREGPTTESNREPSRFQRLRDALRSYDRSDQSNIESRRQYLKLLAAGGVGFAVGVVLPERQILGAPTDEDDRCQPPSCSLAETFPEVFNDPFFESPPERTGSLIDVCEHYDRDIQAAVDAAGEDDTVFVPAECGPYEQQVDVTGKDHLTIESDGATVRQPDPGDSAVISSDRPDRTTVTEIVEPVQEFSNTFRVDDSSGIEVGDDLHIYEDRNPYGEPHYRDYEGGGGTDETEEFVTVASIDENTITTEHTIAFPYPNRNDTRVLTVDWSSEDIRITGLRVNGESGGELSHSPLQMQGIKYGWFDDLEVLGSSSRGLAFQRSMWGRFDRIDFPPPNRYASSADQTTTFVYATNLRTTAGHYIVRAGSTGNRVLVDGVRGHDVNNEVINSHHGGFHTEYRNVRATGAGRLARLRTRYLLLDGFVDETGNTTFQCSGRPDRILVRNGIIRKDDDRIWRFPDDEPSRRELIIDMTFENIYIEEPYPRGFEEMGRFGVDGYGTRIQNLTFRNISLGGVPLERQHINDWRHYEELTNLSRQNITVENPNPPESLDDARLGPDMTNVPVMDDYPRHSS